MSQFFRPSLAATLVAGLGLASVARADSVANRLIYANDFKTRTSVNPIAGVQSFTYNNTGDTFVTAVSSAEEDYDTTNLVQNAVVTNPDKPQPLGIDGWRRLHNEGTASVKISDGASSRGVRFTCGANGTGYAIAAVPIGSKISSGTMRVLVDIKTPSAWYPAANIISYAMVAIGNDHLYNGLKDAGNGYEKFGSTGTLGLYGIGIPDKSSSTDKVYPGFLVGTHPDLGISGRTFDTTKSLSKSKWYRIQLEVNFAKGETTYKLFQHGNTYDSTAAKADTFDKDKEPVYQQTVPFRPESAPKMVSTLALQVYGLGRNSSNPALNEIFFDSIRVFAKPDGATEEVQIYSNPFSSRSVTSLTEKVRIFAPTSADDQDGFFRKGSGLGRMVLTGGDDPMLQFVFNSGEQDSNNDGKWRFTATAQPLGTTCRTTPMRVSVDMRPPCKWVRKPDYSGNNKQLYMGYALAGEQYRTGTLSTVIGSWFGICNTNKVNNSTLSTFFVRTRDGNNNEKDRYPASFVAVDNTHWYRFIADVNTKVGKTTVNVYDLGTAKPTLATTLAENATPVATISDVPFYNARSSIGGIAGQIFYCFNGAYSPFDDKYSPLFDNIRVYAGRQGFTLMVR